MNCSDYVVWISKKLEGSLSGDRLKELRRHLAGCSRCRAELVLQKRIHDSLLKEMPSGLSPDFAQQVSRQALAIAGRKHRILRLPDLVPVFAVAAGAILLLVLSSDLARALAPLMQSLGGMVETSSVALGETVLALLAKLPEVPADRANLVGRLFTPMMTLVMAGGVACIAVFWSFSRVRCFLRG